MIDYKKVNLGDSAIVDFGSGARHHSYHEGIVNMISNRGINVATPYGNRFVKWKNVIKIKKENSNGSKHRIQRMDVSR